MEKAQERTPLLDAVTGYGKRRPTYFCIPGHRYEKGIDPELLTAAGPGVFRMDLTETSLTDDLHAPSGPIKEAQELAAELLGADRSYFLVNGSTCGNQAMIMTAAHEGQTICIPRNAHKSALMGLVQSGAKPVYITPAAESSFGLQGGITPKQVEEMFFAHPECKAVMVVSPTYYGIVSDIEGIAKVCHAHGAMLLVDEAHGAHCYFSDELPGGAMQLGADMCVQSLHKTAGALTQSSILHVKSGLADLSLLEANLRLVQSTSPSYILMASIDAARRDLAMHGEEMARTALDLAGFAREQVNNIRGLRCAGKELVGKAGIFGMDITRLTISAADLGLSGFELKDLLFEEYNIDLEMADELNILAIVTFANTTEDMQHLVEALKEIAENYAGAEPLPAAGKTVPLSHAEKMPPLPEYVISPREAYFAEKKRVPWEEALDKVSAEMIAPYPPGIPVINPGERISKEAWSYIENVRSRKGHMHGPSDPDLDSLLIIE